MQLESAIYINKDYNKVYEAIKNIEEYPRFMLNVENVRIIESNKNYRLSEWRINIYETPIIWQQEDYFDDKDYRIRFRCYKGDLANFEGAWQIEQKNGRSKLRFHVELNWTGPLAFRYSDEFINRKARTIIKAMLRALKRKLDYGIEVVKGDAIVSELINYKNRDGRNIVGYFDHLRRWSKNAPFIILPPGYGETKRDTLSASYYLVKNGFNCIRYDNTDHVGESEGDIINSTMPKMKKDLLSTMDFCESHFGINKFGVVATSLAKRVVIKGATEDSRIKCIVGVVGVVNFRETLKTVHCEDAIGILLEKKELGYSSHDVLGFEVKDEFTKSAIREGYHDLTTTLRDVEKINIPMVFLVAEKDVWVRLDDVRLVFERVKSEKKEFHIIPGVLHQLFENPKAARIAIKQIVVSCAKYLLNKDIKINGVIEPNLREIAVQNRIEKDRLRLLETFTVSKEKAFWSEYLIDFTIINKSKDYRDYLLLMTELLGKIQDGDNILDAGCGVGYFGAWSINSIIEENAKAFKKGIPPSLYPNCRYYGVDFVSSALDIAFRNHRDMKRRFLKKINMDKNFNEFFPCIYQEYDLNFNIPFKDGYFDKICCSLVLSYLNDAVTTMRELIRVLKKGGEIVITSLKPFADLSEVYRNFISVARNERDILEARKLLSSAGKIKRKEGEGHYHFFSDKELKFILLATGGKNLKTFRSLCNQINVAVATK